MQGPTFVMSIACGKKALCQGALCSGLTDNNPPGFSALQHKICCSEYTRMSLSQPTNNISPAAAAVSSSSRRAAAAAVAAVAATAAPSAAEAAKPLRWPCAATAAAAALAAAFAAAALAAGGSPLTAAAAAAGGGVAAGRNLTSVTRLPASIHPTGIHEDGSRRHRRTLPKRK